MGLKTFLAGVAVGMLLSRSNAGVRAGSGLGAGRETGADSPSWAGAGRGAAAGRTGAGEREDPPNWQRTDEQVRERILSMIGRTISHPEAIRVEVQDGCVTLRGQVQARDSVLLMAEVESTAGVTSVQNELEIQGSLDEVAPAMTRDPTVVRVAEKATSHMS